MRNTRFLSTRAPGILGALLAAPAALALGIRLPDQDPFATARGDAFAATANNASALYYNPAGISFLQDQNANVSFYAISLKDTFSPASGGSDISTGSEVAAVPHIYYTYTPREFPLSFGLGVYVPFGLGLSWPSDSPFRAMAISGEIEFLTAQPTVSWKIAEGLSLAAGPMINWSKAELTRGAGFMPGDEFNFEGDGTTVGFAAGVMWQPHPQHSFGAVVRTGTKMNYEGTASLSPSPPLPGSTAATVDFQFPLVFTAGYSFRPSTNWNFEFNLDWTDWDSLNTVTLESGYGTMALPFNWQSSFMYEVGVTRYFGEGWRASGGFVFSGNSVPESSFNPLVPDSNRYIWSIGIGRDWERWRFDFAYQFAWGPSRSVQGTPFGIADGDYTFISNAFSLSVGYNF